MVTVVCLHRWHMGGDTPVRFLAPSGALTGFAVDLHVQGDMDTTSVGQYVLLRCGPGWVLWPCPRRGRLSQSVPRNSQVSYVD